MTLWKWDKATPLNNATADSTIDWSEGQAPSSVNNSARGMMTAVAKFRDDIAGRITTAGTSTAYTVTSNQVFDTLAHMDGAMVGFVPHVSNGATVTLNVDALGAKPLRSAPGVELSANMLILGTPYVATYNNSSGVWYLQGITGDLPFAVPVGALLPYIGSTAPNSNYALPAGQTLAGATYTVLRDQLAALSPAFPYGGNATNFNLPDLRGRIVAALDNLGGSAASRITTLATDSTTITGTALGSAGGSQSHIQTSNELFRHRHSAQLDDLGHTHNFTYHDATIPGGNTGDIGGVGGFTNTTSATASNNTPPMQLQDGLGNLNTTQFQGSSTAMAMLQPTIMLGYIIRVL